MNSIEERTLLQRLRYLSIIVFVIFEHVLIEAFFLSIDQDATLFIAVKATEKCKNNDSLKKVHVCVCVGSETIIKLRSNDICVNPHLWMSRYVSYSC